MMECFQGTYFEHACSKAYQYAIVEERISRGLKYVSLKFAQANLQKCITWPKQSRKGKDEWMKSYIIIGFMLRKLNILIKTKASYFVLIVLIIIVLNSCTPKCCFLINNVNCLGLQTKCSCFKKPFNFEKPLPYVTTSKLILGSLIRCPLHSHGIYHKL
jgi:hypothetical protein